MSVDADDCISKNIAEFVNKNPEKNGWYVDQGYEYDEGSSKIAVKKEGFYRICGTCNIVNYRLFTLPPEMMQYEQLTGYDRFLGGHPLAKGDLAERGTPLEALPFPGVVFVRDQAGESVSMQESFLEKWKRNPKETLRGVKKRLMAPFNEQVLTDSIREEFGLYALNR
ncbi:MAG: hypothetical protein ACRC2M_21545, partial [Planktothrix sp.]